MSKKSGGDFPSLVLASSSGSFWTKKERGTLGGGKEMGGTGVRQ